MIGYIKGTLLNADSGIALLENNGTGYEINCSSSAYSKLVNAGGGEVYTYLQVRDDGLFLYGFESLAEKAMFLKLITVSGIGPKMGIGILSSMNINELALALANSDVKSLMTIKGLGKKTAERLVLELREKVSSSDLDLSKGGAQVAASIAADDDAVIALMTLGFSRAESVKAAAAAKDGGAFTVEEIIGTALKSISRQ